MSARVRHAARAFTLLESMVVASIVALLAALLFPVISNARDRARESACVTKMRQAWLAASLYRSDNEGDGIYGTSFEMGLPPRLADGPKWKPGYPEKLLGVADLVCPAFPSKFSNSTFSYNWMYQDPRQQQNGQNQWDAYVRDFQDASIFIVDPNHNPKDIPTMSPYISKKGFGLTLGGNLIQRYKPGDMDILRWWTTDCTSECPLR